MSSAEGGGAGAATPARARRWLQNGALAAGALALTLLVCEIVIRRHEERLIADQYDALGIHAGGVEAETWRPWRRDGEGLFHVRSSNRRLVYENRPRARVAVERAGRSIVIETNSSGFRDEEFTTSKPPGVFRIAAVGDSVTIGLYFESDEVYPEIAARLLNERGPRDCSFEVYNMGVTGYNAEQEVELIESRVLDFDPDLIVIGYIFNDDEIGQDAGLWAHFTRTPLRTWDFVRLRWLALELRLRSTTLTERSFAELGDWLRRSDVPDVPVLVMIFPILDRGGGEYRHRELHERVRRAASAAGFGVLDLLEAFSPTDVMDKHDGDTLHPSAAGHRLAGEALAAFVLAHPELRCPPS